MAAALAFTGTLAALHTVTCSATGFAATTAFVASIATPQGHTQTVQFKTDGSGNASFPIVPSIAGTHTVTVVPAVAATTATGSFNAGGHAL